MGGFGGAVSGGISRSTARRSRATSPGKQHTIGTRITTLARGPGITGPLWIGDVALGYGAQAKYHVMPGQMFTDEYGRTWRFADRSGSKDPLNVDVFKGAMGGILRKPTHALIGESGPEAVIPLSQANAEAAGVGGLSIVNNITANGPGDPEAIAQAVERVVKEHWRRQAVV